MDFNKLAEQLNSMSAAQAKFFYIKMVTQVAAGFAASPRGNAGPSTIALWSIEIVDEILERLSKL